MASLAMNKYFLSPDAGGGRYRVAGIERAIRSFQWGLAQRYPFPSPPLASATFCGTPPLRTLLNKVKPDEGFKPRSADATAGR